MGPFQEIKKFKDFIYIIKVSNKPKLEVQCRKVKDFQKSIGTEFLPFI